MTPRPTRLIALAILCGLCGYTLARAGMDGATVDAVDGAAVDAIDGAVIVGAGGGGPTCSGDYGHAPSSGWADTGFSGLATNGIVVALKVTLDCDGTVSSGLARAYNANTGAELIKMVVYSHDAGNDRPDTIILEGTATFDAATNGAYANVSMPLSGSLSGHSIVWVAVFSSASPTRFSYTGSGSIRTIRMNLESGEYAGDTALGDAWTDLANYASATVATDRDYNLLITFP